MRSRVLLVDEDPRIPRVFERIFRQDAIDLVVLKSPAEALSLVEAERVAVVVADERLNGMSGTDLLAKVKRQSPATVRILFTSFATFECALAAINEAEVFRFLLKPCSLVELANVIRESLDRREVFAEARRLLAVSRAQGACLEKLQRRGADFLDQELVAADFADTVKLDCESLVDQMRYEVDRFSERFRPRHERRSP